MTVSELHEVTLIDRDIEAIHQTLRELYDRRAQLMKHPATDQPTRNTNQSVPSKILQAIDLSLQDRPRRLMI